MISWYVPTSGASFLEYMLKSKGVIWVGEGTIEQAKEELEQEKIFDVAWSSLTGF